LRESKVVPALAIVAGEPIQEKMLPMKRSSHLLVAVYRSAGEVMEFPAPVF